MPWTPAIKEADSNLKRVRNHDKLIPNLSTQSRVEHFEQCKRNHCCLYPWRFTDSYKKTTAAKWHLFTRGCPVFTACVCTSAGTSWLLGFMFVQDTELLRHLITDILQPQVFACGNPTHKQEIGHKYNLNIMELNLIWIESYHWEPE